MIRLKANQPQVMEFTTFEKSVNITNEDFITLAMKFEKEYLSTKNGIAFHCLVRNLKGEYANLLFAESMEVLKEIEKGFTENEAAVNFLENINLQTVKIHHHKILKEKFQIPDNFACFEHGTFVPKAEVAFYKKELLSVSQQIENEYLNTFENSLGHFIGKVDDERFSEIVFGKTLGKTREICYGYLGIESGMKMLNMFDPKTVDLDFWYLIA